MSLFQKSVEKKYLNDLDSTLTDKKYADFQNYFGNPAIQENIRNSKEEQFQEGFLRELFVKILGYTLNPEPNFNLTTELKNIANSKKADGAILRTAEHAPLCTTEYTEKKGEHAPPEVIAVIELKGTDTTDLDKIETQAFGYKNHHPKCKYVITSNFEKLRFYIQNAVDHVDFDLFNLTREQFSLLWLCLAKENLLNDIPLKIKESSVLQEENITKKLYSDYSKFREAIYNNLVKNNPETDKLLLFKKTQKLLDRFLFVFFAEDRLLLPPNSISEIVKQWNTLKDLDAYVPLYDRFKKYFRYMNTGYKGKKYDIYAYNGGLFAPDEILDNISIDDEILYKHTLTLTQYDFETDVDVNILGHIFEHSLGEIENIQATIAEEPATPENAGTAEHARARKHASVYTGSILTEKGESATPEHAPGHLQTSPQTKGEHAPHATSKRKKDGIFYTPKYITKYIVENTVGKLCEEKRVELGIVDEKYAKGRKNRKKEIVRTLDKKLDDYRNWLLTLTILDPACGSGAFLNQALEFLINEHRKIDELRGQLLGGAIIFSDITTDILEKNIYGVDLNEESVEIAKLSLWLRTAQKGRKLNTLSNNIKCGNSLIDDPEVAGEKAFNWQNEFPNIFQKKNKKAWHVTTATHNSRYSQRMFDNHVKKGEPVWLSEKEEIIVTETIAEIVEKDKLNMLAYNICGDHAHMIIVCAENELPKIVQKIKAMSARACNIAMGRTIPETETGEHAPRMEPAADAGTPEHAPAHPVPHTEKSGEHAPQRGRTQFHLWAKKFDGKEITSNEQLENTIAYIQNNRKKHGLAPNEGVSSLAEKITCTRAHAFRNEFTGGFDVVIGNPPYVQLQTMGEMSEKLKSCGYETFDKAADLYCLFTERGYNLLKKGGMQSFVMPNKWMLVAYGKPLRKFLSKTGLRQILNFGDIQFFEEATTYVCIFVTSNSGITRGACSVLSMNRKTYHGDFLSEVKANSYDCPSSLFGENEWSIQPHGHFTVLEKMKQIGPELKELPVSIYRGILTGYNNAFYIDDETRKKLIAADAKSAGLIKPMVRGRDISAYGITGFEYLIGTFPTLKLDIEDYPAIKQHLLSFGYDRLKQTGEKGSRKKTSGKWFETQDSIAYHKEFDKPKIMYPNMTSQFPFLYDESGLLSNDKSFILTANGDSVSLPFLTALFNSSLSRLWIWYNCPELQGGTREIRKVYFEHFPVPRATNEQTALLAQLATERTQQAQQLQTAVDGFKNFLKAKTEPGKLSGKLENWHALNSSEFIKELRKNIASANKERTNKELKPLAKLTLSKEAEWMDYFNEQKEKTQTIKLEIKKTDKEIDRMVYALYGLTEEEIKIVEETV